MAALSIGLSWKILIHTNIVSYTYTSSVILIHIFSQCSSITTNMNQQRYRHYQHDCELFNKRNKTSGCKKYGNFKDLPDFISSSNKTTLQRKSLACISVFAVGCATQWEIIRSRRVHRIRVMAPTYCEILSSLQVTL